MKPPVIRRLSSTDIREAFRQLRDAGKPEVSSADVRLRAGGAHATIVRHLNGLVEEGAVVRHGSARATRYSLAPTPEAPGLVDRADARVSPTWSSAARSLFGSLNRPLGAREPVTYRREFVDAYVPNRSHLLPRELAESLAREGRMPGQQPAGTYARRVLEQLLVDLSWSSSRLEGNTYSLLATETLFKSGALPTDTEGVMLLNHKRAIEFLVDAAPGYGLVESVVRNLHALLMQDLLADSFGLGAIRTRVVNISGTTYVPSQVPQILEEMLSLVVATAQRINNPVEAAFFLWVNLAYLQPFEDGNKRTSRLAANVPLMLYNCAPIAFLDIDPGDYALAMLGVYEELDLAVAVELFEWTYRRSVRKYRVIMEAMGAPDPFRIRYRERLGQAVQKIVREGGSLARAIGELDLPATDADAFAALLVTEIEALTQYNCARYRVTAGEMQAWIARGKPRS